MADDVDLGRMQVVRRPRRPAPLTGGEIESIRRGLMVQLNRQGLTYRFIGRVMRCSASTVCNIVNQKARAGR